MPSISTTETCLNITCCKNSYNSRVGESLLFGTMFNLFYKATLMPWHANDFCINDDTLWWETIAVAGGFSAQVASNVEFWRWLVVSLNTFRGVVNRRSMRWHYDDVIMGAIASQITSLTIVYSTVYSGADQSKHQSSASLVFVWGIHRGQVNSPHKWPVTRIFFPFKDVIMVIFTMMATWQKSHP